MSQSSSEQAAVENDAPTPRCDVLGHGFLFYWACECGRSGQPTTNGRAVANRDRHRRTHERVIPPAKAGA